MSGCDPRALLKLIIGLKISLQLPPSNPSFILPVMSDDDQHNQQFEEVSSSIFIHFLVDSLSPSRSAQELPPPSLCNVRLCVKTDTSL